MLVLISYGVSVVSKGGTKRLRLIAKTCLDYGSRVQNSVFECEVDPAQFTMLKTRLRDIYDPEEDSLRFYFSGSQGRRGVEHHGAKPVQDMVRDALIL